MSEQLDAILPQLASGAAHTHALGFAFVSRDGDRVRIRAPYRDDLVGDPDTGVLSGGLVTTLLDHVGGPHVVDPQIQRRDRLERVQRDLIAEARCYRLTRSIAFVRAWAFEDSPDDPVAAAQAAYILPAERPRRTTGEGA
jgi:acyl-coenzyme A thioesterase PaaI-like protein